MRNTTIPAAVLLCTALAGCGMTLSRSNGPGGEPPLLAEPKDHTLFGLDSQKGRGLNDGQAAIAYDPDGCQVWIIDDGAEGYSSRRRDPVSGLPVCDNRVKPGYVVGDPRVNRVPDLRPRG
ncbi:hypothetical protein [Paragemmobacter straminiformis]|uniref:Lipoprotein n=1 Tax=Paragemmobacter straminiformis TaxID=2045119 RepID=A0A842ICR7_9RHOB|nr:hypothetical protein [Gemmobacter straminiformis]MBC2837183.1 hypothetical protein [Gemmobacter straminiformis]